MPQEDIAKCPRCDSENLRQVKGRESSYRCRECNKQFVYHGNLKPTGEGFLQYQNSGEINKITNQRIQTLEQLIKVCEIDTKYWEVERWICNKWEVGSKTSSGGIQVEPLFQVKAYLKKRVQEIRNSLVVEEIRKDALNHSPKYERIKYEKQNNGYLYEIAIPDIHFGRLAWSDESGDNYDVKIAEKIVRDVVNDLLSISEKYSISRILLPFGNDYFNVNSKDETTSHGTPQQEDTRFQKTFRLGRQLAVFIIEQCSAIAPTDVVIVPGNHDEERTFYMGDALECWFHQNPNVSIDNAARKRKYYTFGKNLIGFTHGYYEKVDRLPLIMAQEVPGLWAETVTREWHLGHIHSKKELQTRDDETQGIMIRYLRSLAGADAWTFDKGFIGGTRAAEGFLWDRDRGVKAQFTAYPNY